MIGSADLDVASWQAGLDRLDALGEDQRKRVAEFARRWTWDHVTGRFVKLYASLL